MGVIWGARGMIRKYFEVVWGVEGGGKKKKRGGGTAFSLCTTTQACCPLAFLLLCQNYFWLEKESVYSVAWFAGVTPCSHRANPLFPIQNGLHIFPVTQGLKRMRGKSRGWAERGWGDAAIITGFTCSQLLAPFTQLFWKQHRILSRNCRCSRSLANRSLVVQALNRVLNIMGLKKKKKTDSPKRPH